MPGGQLLFKHQGDFYVADLAQFGIEW